MKKILIVEDDRNIALALAVRLKAASYEVLTASNGVAGVELVKTQNPDLVVMDICLPAGLGLSVAQRLKELRLDHIPIIFITASRRRGLQQAVRGLGAAAFFEKPYDPQQLMETIASIIASSPENLSAN